MMKRILICFAMVFADVCLAGPVALYVWNTTQHAFDSVSLGSFDGFPYLIFGGPVAGVTNGCGYLYDTTELAWLPISLQGDTNAEYMAFGVGGDGSDASYFLDGTNAGAVTLQDFGGYPDAYLGPDVPAVVLSKARLAGGFFQFQFNTASNVNYQVNFSTNLRIFAPLAVVAGTAGPITFTDTNNARAVGYYRVSLALVP
ncbi:MAG TPA: hypothetical protein VGO59_09130 [Verrucomicrobiae bacterium]